MHWTEIALKKVGCGSREEFQRRNRLPISGQWDLATCRSLWNYLAGFVYHTIAPGENLYRAARRHGASVQGILEANPRIKGDLLTPGQSIKIPLDCPVVPWDVPFSSWIQEVYLEGLLARCSRLEAKPLTETAGNRTVWVLRLGTGPRRVLLTAGHHGSEYITSYLLWRLLEDYCAAIRDDGGLYGFSARALLRQTSLYVVPLVNPDGADLAAGAIDPNSAEYQGAKALAARQEDVPFPGGWKANLQGVDLNLNYPACWEKAREQKAQWAGPKDYPGEKPLSQPETKALADFTRRLKPHAVAAWHTQGGEIYAADREGRMPDGELAKRMARTSGYCLRQVPPESANAGYRDWVLQEFGIPAFTIEAGHGVSPLPISDLPELYEENLPIFALLLAGV